MIGHILVEWFSERKKIKNIIVYHQTKTFAEPTEHVDSIEQLIKDTLICLEDDDFEKARRLMDKVEKYSAVDQNIMFLKKVVNQSLVKQEDDFSDSYCY